MSIFTPKTSKKDIMIDIDKSISPGDKVFGWYSVLPIPVKAQLTGKPPYPEVEFKVLLNNEKYFQLQSVNGDYTILFDRSNVATWYGRFHKV